MIYELRIYTTIPNRMPNLLKRFKEHTLPLWDKHGIKQVGFWTTLVGPNNNDLTYLLEWASLDERETRFNAFMADPVWIAAKTASEADGPINAQIASSFLMPTAFSKLQ